MASYTERRKFWPRFSVALPRSRLRRAQQADRVRRIGLLQGLAESDLKAQAGT
jgi:hypothetical protein